MIDSQSAEVMRRLSGAKRLAIIDGLYEMAWNLAEANIRSRMPAGTDLEIRSIVARRIADDSD